MSVCLDMLSKEKLQQSDCKHLLRYQSWKAISGAFMRAYTTRSLEQITDGPAEYKYKYIECTKLKVIGTSSRTEDKKSLNAVTRR